MIAPRTTWKGGELDRTHAVLLGSRAIKLHGHQAAHGLSSGPLPAPSTITPIPAYRIHRTKGLGYVRLNGRMVYLGKANSVESLDRYRRLVGEWLVSGRLLNARSSSMAKAMTVAGMVDAYLDWSKDYYVDEKGRPSGGFGPVGSAAKILKELYGSTVASEFGPLALKAMRLEMIERNLCASISSSTNDILLTASRDPCRADQPMSVPGRAHVRRRTKKGAEDRRRELAKGIARASASRQRRFHRGSTKVTARASAICTTRKENERKIGGPSMSDKPSC
jgi:hypothetical protein